jgi:uncharacterized protein DUF4238
LNDPRKHHYVPVFYQKHFANAKGLLWVYDRKLQTYKELHPDVICFERDLYALKPDAAPKDQQVELMALSLADGYCATAVRELVPGDPPSFETLVTIAYFAGLQSSRLPSVGKFISAIYKKGVEEMMRLTSVSVERMQSTLDRYAEKTGEAITVSAESMVEAVRDNQVEVVIREVPFLRHIFQYATFLNKQFIQFSWEILVASPDRGFILCDDPVVIVPPRGVTAVGLIIPDSVKYFPLTRSLCVRMGDIGDMFRYKDVDRETVRVINQNIAANSSRFIMGPVIEQLESVVLRSASTTMDSTPRHTIETSDQNDDGSLQKISTNPRRYFYLNNARIAP